MVIVDRGVTQAKRTAADLCGDGGRAQVVPLDVPDADACIASAAAIEADGAIAKEYGRYGIRSNAVTPGMVIPDANDIGEGSYWTEDTGADDRAIADIERRTPPRRRAIAQDVASTTIFLASERVRQLTGQVVSVSGGFAMPR